MLRSDLTTVNRDKQFFRHFEKHLFIKNTNTIYFRIAHNLVISMSLFRTRTLKTVIQRGLIASEASSTLRFNSEQNPQNVHTPLNPLIDERRKYVTSLVGLGSCAFDWMLTSASSSKRTKYSPSSLFPLLFFRTGRHSVASNGNVSYRVTTCTRMDGGNASNAFYIAV